MGNVEAPRYWLPRPRRDLTLTAREPERPSDALFQCLSIAAPERERHADRGPKTVIERARGDFMRVSFATHHHPPRPTTPLFPHCTLQRHHAAAPSIALQAHPDRAGRGAVHLRTAILRSAKRKNTEHRIQKLFVCLCLNQLSSFCFSSHRTLAKEFPLEISAYHLHALDTRRRHPTPDAAHRTAQRSLVWLQSGTRARVCLSAQYLENKPYTRRRERYNPREEREFSALLTFETIVPQR